MLPLMSWKNIIKWEINWLFFALNSFHLSSSNGVPFIYYQCALSAVGWGCCQSPSRCHWLKTVRQKKSSWRHLFPRKEKKTLPTSVRDGDRDRPQLSPAVPIGWHFVQNLTQTTSLTTHQQILKAYMQPPSFTPPLSQRFRTSCRRSTLNFYLQWRRLLLLCSGLWYSPFMRQDVVDFYWLLLFLPEDTK